MLYPISYSIPEEVIVPFVPFKTIHKAQVQYGFTKVEDYLENYRKSIFAHTSLKCGWDCLRHYEILSQGTIPHFVELDKCPKRTLHSFPKEKVLWLIQKYYDLSFSEILQCSSSELYKDLNDLLEITRTTLTTKAEAKYLLSKTTTPDSKRILYLTNAKQSGDYIIDTLAHGLFRITDGECDFFPNFDALYDDYPLEESWKLYGRGFNYTRFLPASQRKKTSPHTIWDNIQTRHYDQIILSINHSNEGSIPFTEGEVNLFNYYQRNEVSLVCGRDCDPFTTGNNEWHIKMKHECPWKQLADKGFNVFIRELGDDGDNRDSRNLDSAQEATL